MISLIKKVLALNHTSDKFDLDDPNTTLVHREVILSKPFLKKIYLRWYEDLMARVKNLPINKIIEIAKQRSPKKIAIITDLSHKYYLVDMLSLTSEFPVQLVPVTN